MDTDLLFSLKIKETELAFVRVEQDLKKVKDAKDEKALLSIIAEQLVLLNNKAELIRIKLC